MKKYKQTKIIKLFIQFFKFGLVGLINTALSLLIYYSLIFLGVHFLVANSIAFIITVYVSFILNRKHVFHQQQDKTVNIVKSVIKTYIAYGASFLIGSATLYLMVKNIGISDKIAPIFNLFLTVPLNFILVKFWAFKKQ